MGPAWVARDPRQSDHPAAQRHQPVAIELVYIDAEQTKIPNLARVVFGQLLPDDRKIEWANTLGDAEALLVGIHPEPSAGEAVVTTDVERLERARSVFVEMQRHYAAGNFVRYGELLEQILAVP